LGWALLQRTNPRHNSIAIDSVLKITSSSALAATTSLLQILMEIKNPRSLRHRS
jgi:hypothetical protein